MRQQTYAYEPIFGAHDSIVPEFDDAKIGERFEAILNYEVIEKTKSYVILKVNYVHLKPKKRIL